MRLIRLMGWERTEKSRFCMFCVASGALAAAGAARAAAGEAAVKKPAPGPRTAGALQEQTTYSSYPDQHKLFENWNKFVKSTKE